MDFESSGYFASAVPIEAHQNALNPKCHSRRLIGLSKSSKRQEPIDRASVTFGMNMHMTKKNTCSRSNVYLFMRGYIAVQSGKH
jgi:hypothetical protein